LHRPRFLDTDHARRVSCFIGVNGAGKTALLNILISMLPPDSGTIKLGTNLSPPFSSTSDERRSTPSRPWRRH